MAGVVVARKFVQFALGDVLQDALHEILDNGIGAEWTFGNILSRSCSLAEADRRSQTTKVVKTRRSGSG